MGRDWQVEGAVTEYYDVVAEAVYEEGQVGGDPKFVSDLKHRQGAAGREDNTVVIYEQGFPIKVSTITGERV